MIDTSRPRILYLDAYDSFSNNIISLLRATLNAEVTALKIDDERFRSKPHHVFHEFCHRFDGIVAGPGPGHPGNARDVGLIALLWTLPDHLMRPVLGICLGFQSLVLAHGGSVERLREPRHGIVREVSHRGSSLFRGVEVALATQYHSLHASLGHDGAESSDNGLWLPTSKVPTLLPLAWDLLDYRNGPVLMAVQHATRPFYGVQYHPESICTDLEGAKIISNWWHQTRSATFVEPGQQIKRRRLSGSNGGMDSGYGSENEPVLEGMPSAITPTDSGVRSRAHRVQWRSTSIFPLIDPVLQLFQLARHTTGQEPVLLESGTKGGKPVRLETGRFSIIGLVEKDADHLRYNTSNRRFVHAKAEKVISEHAADVSVVYDKLQAWTAQQKAADGPNDIPFWGGLVGHISYEAGLETLLRAPSAIEHTYPDIHFVSVVRSIVIDHVQGIAYVQSVRPEPDEAWIEQTVKDIVDLRHKPSALEDHGTIPWKGVYKRPDKHKYCQKVAQCQSHIRAGNSYELCLTDQSSLSFESSTPTAATIDSEPTPFKVYSRLRRLNPAPFAAYMSLPDGVSIMSSSPERFLSFTRDGSVQFRPIKGTVRKSATMTRERAEAILNSDKERAENLMIVDLIRHDLNGVLLRQGAGQRAEAEVPTLMQVEEYETVYQLVSVIQGQLGTAGAPVFDAQPDTNISHLTPAPTGLDVLAASLPPGSMTGAPKKRSCELLREIEGGVPRGIYSGVLGYLDVGGGGDFSVVIRSIVRYPDGQWRAGAGGAVTALSEPLAEYEEMLGKCMAVRLE